MVQYELGPLPWALAKPNGKMSNSPKSTLINTFEKDTFPTCARKPKVSGSSPAATYVQR